jgi:octaprenyl-diphosphate synthase
MNYMDQQYTLRLEKIEAELNRRLPENPGPAWQAEVFPGMSSGNVSHLLPALTAPGRDLLSRGGKRWRPLLMTLVCEALGGGDAALPLAPLVEFCHNASLIHDDIEDNSDERRGKPAVHIIHGVDTAINSGCFLYFLSAACIDSWAEGRADTASSKAKMYSLWADYMRRLHLGQAMDIYWHRNVDVFPPLEEYFSMCALKTGCLARFAADAGIVAAETEKNSSPHSSLALTDASEKLGVGFQILDDVKNLTVGIPGKKRGDDIAEGKKSLPVLLFVHRRPEMRETVCRCFNVARSGAGVSETEELIQALAAEGVLAEAEDQGKALIAQAREVFAESGNLLAGFTDLLI